MTIAIFISMWQAKTRNFELSSQILCSSLNNVIPSVHSLGVGLSQSFQGFGRRNVSFIWFENQAKIQCLYEVQRNIRAYRCTLDNGGFSCIFEEKRLFIASKKYSDFGQLNCQGLKIFSDMTYYWILVALWITCMLTGMQCRNSQI